MIKAFKVIAFWEGISLILLFFFAMPLKYIWNMPMAVSIVGMAHGILFMMYVVLAFILNAELNWNKKTLFGVLVASLVPFGTFYMDKKYSDVIYDK